MKNIKRKNIKKQKGGFFNIGGRETKSQRDLIVKCDLTDVNRINDPFLMKDKINRCCPSSTFSFFAKNKSIKCNDMKRRYEELLKKNRQHYLKNELNINNIHDPVELEKMYIATCPRDRFGFKNGSRLCREIDAKYRQLVLEDKKRIGEFNSEFSKPNSRRRLSDFGRNMINMFNNSTKKNKEQEQLQQKPNKDNDNDINFGIDSIPITQAEIAATPSKPELQAPSKPELQAPSSEEPKPESQIEATEIKTGGKKIKRKSKKIIKRRKNTKTRRR